MEVIKVKRKRGEKLYDCIDIQCEIEPVAFDEVAKKAPAESSVSIRNRVIKACALYRASCDHIF